MLTLKQEIEWDRKMYMRVNWDWANEQLKTVGYNDTKAGSVVLELLGVLEASNFKPSHEAEFTEILSHTLELFKGHPIEPETNDVWTSHVAGNIHVRDTVRVRRDAYLGDRATQHNGKRGRVLNMRNGSISVHYDGANIETPSNHLPQFLEKLVVN